MQLTEEQKAEANKMLQDKINSGELTTQEQVDAWKQEYLASVKPAPAQAQTGAPVQDGIAGTDSNLAPGSLEQPSADPETEKALKNPRDIGAWENFKNNVSNVITRVRGFDDRLSLVAVDTFEKLLGKEAADKLYAALPTYEQNTGQWLDSTDDVRAEAYRQLEALEGRNEQTIGLIDAWEEGDVSKILSAAGGAGLNMASTLITSGLTLGAGLYTDMMGDAIAEANKEKAIKLYGDDDEASIKRLYDENQAEFQTPAMIGIAGGLLESLGARGVGKYIRSGVGRLAGDAGVKAYMLAQNMGVEGTTEWLQTGLEAYNRGLAKGEEGAAADAWEVMTSREGLEAALQGAIGAGVGGGVGKAAGYYGERAAERAGLLKKGETPTADMAEAADDKDMLFDSKDADKNYKSQVDAVAEAKATLEKDFAETTVEERDAAREVIQEDEAQKRAERTEQRRLREVKKNLNDTYFAENPDGTEAGRIAYVTRQLQEQEGIQTFDQALDMAKAKNRDARKIVTKAFIAARTPAEQQLVDDINANMQSAKVALQKAPDGPARAALQELVDGYNADLQNVYATANRKVLYAEPAAVADAIEAYDEIQAANEQERTIQADTTLDQNLKDRLLGNIEDKRAAAIEKGEVARTKMEQTSSKNVEETNTEAKLFEEVLAEEVNDNTKSTDDLTRVAAENNMFQDPDAQPVIDETLAKNRQPIDVVDGARVYGVRYGGTYPGIAEALQAKTQMELDAKAKGYKYTTTITDAVPSRPGGDQIIEMEIYKPREQDLTDAVNALKQQDEQALEEGQPVDQTIDEEVAGQELAPEQEIVEESAEAPVRTEQNYISDVAAQYGAEVAPSQLGEGAYILQGGNNRTPYNIIGGLKKRGHSEAQFIETPSGTLIYPGPRDEGNQIEYNIAEIPQDETPKVVKRRTYEGFEEAPGTIVEMNIGMENNPEGYEGILDILDRSSRMTLGSSEQANGEYNGEPERTVVVKAKYNGSQAEFNNYIQRLNKKLTQEAIGTTYNGEGNLIYDPDYRGERYTFDPQFFITPEVRERNPEAITQAERLEQAVRERAAAREVAGKAPRAKQATEEQLEKITGRGPVIQETERQPGGEEVIRELEGRFTPEKQKQVLPKEFLGKTRSARVKQASEGFINNPTDRTAQTNAIREYIPFANKIANYAQRGGFGDQEIQAIAQATMSEAFLTGQYGEQQFNPQTPADINRQLGGFIRDAIRNYYINEGAPYGTTGRTAQSNATLNEIRRAQREIEKEVGPLAQGTTKVGAKGKSVTKKLDFSNPQEIADRINETRRKKFEAGRLKKYSEIAPETVQRHLDLESQFQGELPGQSADIFEDIAGYDDRNVVAEGIDQIGRGERPSIAGIAGLDAADLEGLSAREIGQRINYKDLKNNLGKIARAISDNDRTQKRITNRFDEILETSKQPTTALKDEVGKLIKAEVDSLGKQTTPSQASDFSIEEGTATRVTDTGKAKASKQVNSHGQDWKTTADELNNVIKNTDFDNDWVQWSPGILDTKRGLAKGMSHRRIMELQKQPGRVAKIAAKNGLKLRSDLWNPGVYHIYKPGKPGSPNAEAQFDGWEALERANPNYIKIVSEALQKAWPNIKIANTQAEITKAARELGIPATQIKGAYVVGENTVLINPGMATYDTPIHEFAHIWEKQLQIENPELWQRGVELLKGSEFMKAVDNIPAYRNYRKSGQLNRFYGEVMAHAIGKRGYQIFGSKRAAGSWDSWMKDFTNWFKKKLGISTTKPYDQMTLDDWLETATHGVFTGTTPKKIQTGGIELSLNEKFKSNAQLELEKDQAAKAAARAPKRGWFNRATDWLVGPAADDYHGLVERFKTRYKNDPVAKKFDDLTKRYVDGYSQYEKDATNARETFAKQGLDLANKLGIKRDGLDNYLAEDSGVEYKGAPLSNNQLLEVYTNPNGFDSDLVDQVENALSPEVKEFADNLGFKVEGSVQGSLLNYINKELFKDSMQDFLSYKDQNFNTEVLNDLGAKMGPAYQSAIDNSLKRMSGSSGQPTDAITQKWNDWLNNSVGAIMFLNVRSAALQGLSIWNYMSPSNLYGFNRDLGAIFNPSSEQRKMFTELWNDPMLKERRARAGFDVNANEILEAAKQGNLGKFTQKALNKGFILTSTMDSFAIAAGGTAYVRNAIKNGVSKEDALQQWREKTQESQQSARPDRVSQQQKASVSKFILAFANTPAQYFRLSQKAYRAIKQHGITSPQGMRAARQIAYYMAIQNAIFTMAQSASTALITGWGDEEEEKEAQNALNSMISTGLRGMGLYGAVISAAKDAIINASRESEKSNPDYSAAVLKGALQVSPPLNRKINQIQGIGRAYKYRQERSKTGLRSPHAVAVGKGGEALFNLPTDWIQKKLAATQALYEGDATLEEYLWLLGGYSEWSVLGKKDKGGLDLDLDLDLDNIDLDDLDI